MVGPTFRKAPFVNLEMNDMGIGCWGETLPDLELSPLLNRHNCIELSYLDPHIARQVRPLPGVSRTCADMINSLETPALLSPLPCRSRATHVAHARHAA